MTNKLFYLKQEPKQIKEKNPAILLLHGYGSNEEDLFSFASELPEDYFIFSARAPLVLEPYGYAWFPITFDFNGVKSVNPQEVFDARTEIMHLITTLEKEYPIDSKNFNLVGFSQGAILSYLLAFSFPEKFKNVVALSGYFKEEFLPELQPKSCYQHLNFFVSHGTADQIINFEDGKKATELLNQLEIKHTFHSYPIGHGVSPQNFFDFKKFLEQNR